MINLRICQRFHTIFKTNLTTTLSEGIRMFVFIELFYIAHFTAKKLSPASISRKIRKFITQDRHNIILI